LREVAGAQPVRARVILGCNLTSIWVAHSARGRECELLFEDRDNTSLCLLRLAGAPEPKSNSPNE
jgi:hypothetical protein